MGHEVDRIRRSREGILHERESERTTKRSILRSQPPARPLAWTDPHHVFAGSSRETPGGPIHPRGKHLP